MKVKKRKQNVREFNYEFINIGIQINKQMIKTIKTNKQIHLRKKKLSIGLHKVPSITKFNQKQLQTGRSLAWK